MAAGDGGRLRLGFVSLADYGVLPGLLKAYKAARPGVDARAARDALARAGGGARGGRTRFRPAAAARSRGADLEHVVVQRERFVAALPARHRLARSARQRARGARARRRSLRHGAARRSRPGCTTSSSRSRARAGFAPRVAQEAIQMQTVVSLVSSGLGVALVPGLGRQPRPARRRLPRDSPTRTRASTCGSPGAAARSGVAAREFVQHARRMAR